MASQSIGVAARRAASLLSVVEFQALCGFLDAKYGRYVRFDVIRVMRVDNKIKELTIRITDGPEQNTEVEMGIDAQHNLFTRTR